MSSSSRSTDGHAVELYGGHADADGHALAIFAAGADAFVQLQIVADHGDVFEGFGAVADERGVADIPEVHAETASPTGRVTSSHSAKP